MTENERLSIIQKELGFKSQAEFATALGIKQGSLSDIYRQKKGVGVSNSIKSILRDKFSINIDWLETGNGDMKKSDSEYSSIGRKEYQRMLDRLDVVLDQNSKLLDIIDRLTSK